MRCKFLCVLVTLLAYQAGAQAASITIDAATNIFLASTTGEGGGLAPVANLLTGQFLVFSSVTGTTNCCSGASSFDTNPD